MKTLLVSLVWMVMVRLAYGQALPEPRPEGAEQVALAFVLGLVKQPGQAQRVTKDLTLLKALDAAGGSATGKFAIVIRKGKQMPVDLAELREKPFGDILLEGWDIVVITAAAKDLKAPVLPSSVAVVGDLRSPQVVLWTDKLTALEAFLMVGSWAEYGNSERFFIFRDRKALRFQIREIIREPSKNPVLEPWDILWHPPGFWDGLEPK